MSTCKSVLFFIATLLASPAASLRAATVSNDGPFADSSGIAAEKLQAAQAKLAHMQQIASRFSDEAVALGYADNAWRFELVNHLMRADLATLGRVEAATDLRSALQVAAAPSMTGPKADSLGAATNDLVYVPITPCRIVDTRNSGAGGNFGAGESRTYTYQGGAAQGGATCTTATGATPAALAINATVVSSGLGNNPAAFGFLSIYPEGGSPTTSWLNYLGSDTKANAGVAAINQGSGKFSVFAQNPTNVIVDLFGVFRAATDGTPNFVAKWDGAGTLGTSSIWDGGAGRIGIGTTAPTHSLEFFGNYPQIHLLELNGRAATLSRYTDRFEITASDVFQVSAGAGGTADLFVAANHDVGIGTNAPASRLQIGSVGSSGYSGNDIAIGNGTQASGLAQTANYVQWYSTTNIALMPGNGSGRVGINTTSPSAPLEVDGYAQPLGASNYSYFKTQSSNGNISADVSTCTGCAANVSIRATDNVMATEFDAYSDTRIKDIIGVSDMAKDLDTLNAIEVTDYTLKDKVVSGNKPFKKVIAQQVESVYPQVVSRHVDYIPNVYRNADSVTKNGTGYTLHFADAHGVNADAKRLKLLIEGESAMRKVAVLGVPSAQDIVIDASNIDGRMVFVYGEEVDDFRTVDYEGLTALNISATQELALRLQRQQIEAEATARAKDVEIATLRAELAAQAARINSLQNLAGEVAALKAKKTTATEPVVAYAASAKP